MTSDQQKLAKALATYIMSSAPPWPAISAAAATGNAGQEDLFKPVTTGPKDHGSDGLWQWREGRLDGPNGLKQWCADKGFDWTLMESQVVFMKWEMEKFYPALCTQMLNPGTRTLENLTANFMNEYERPNPALAALDTRIKYAQETYAMLVVVPSTPPPGQAPQFPTMPPPPAAPAPSPDTSDLFTRLQASHDRYEIAQKAVNDALAALNTAKQQLILDAQAAQDYLDKTKEQVK